MKRLIFYVLAVSLIFFSCGSAQRTGREADETADPQKMSGNLLPLANGWYQYDFTRTLKGIEDEQNFFASTGMKMVQEMTWKYSGVVTNFENGSLYDPVTGIELLIDSKGIISCAENVSIRGALNNDGTFSWSGIHVEHERINSIFVKGNMTPLPASERGGREYDGVYHMTDSGTGKRQLVKISGGFYVWNYIDEVEAGFTPWPVLIKKDGTFSFSMDLTTVMEMGTLSKMNYSTGFLSEGKVVPGKGISMEEVTRSAGMGTDSASGAPQIYSGTQIRAGEFPNEMVPKDIDEIIKTGKSQIQKLPKPDRASYPAWYIDLPVKTGLAYAAGEKTFDDKDTAFTMAQAAAAANLADQIMTRIISSSSDVSGNMGTAIDDRIRTEALSRLNYKVAEQYYNPNTKTAFVLLEMEIK